MYADITASRVHQHRVALEKHAHAARQAKIAHAVPLNARKAPAKRTSAFAGWTIPALRRAPRPVTV
jgi:hypothetical protein